MENLEQSIQACLYRLDIGYVDYGFIHCLDEEKDWKAYQEGGALNPFPADSFWRVRHYLLAGR